MRKGKNREARLKLFPSRKRLKEIPARTLYLYGLRSFFLRSLYKYSVDVDKNPQRPAVSGSERKDIHGRAKSAVSSEASLDFASFANAKDDSRPHLYFAKKTRSKRVFFNIKKGLFHYFF
ncbi:hypothetical protein [Parelusimicrobium proximum]|uniref:hypothetical protein n=1 Tax=Parelusimicrobium proximum TaxID=3228953 RepID=UPI003D17C648